MWRQPFLSTLTLMVHTITISINWRHWGVNYYCTRNHLSAHHVACTALISGTKILTWSIFGISVLELRRQSWRGLATYFFKTQYLTYPTATPVDVVVKSLKDLENIFQGYLPHSEIQMEALDNLTYFFTTTSATTTVTGAILTAAAYTRVQRDSPGPMVTTLPPRVHNSLTTVPALVIEYPQVTEYNTPE